MTKEQYDEALQQEKDRYKGLTVELLDDEPTGVGYYGERGMRATVIDVVAADDDDRLTVEYFMYRLDFAAHREHNKQHERKIWYKGNDLVTATEGNHVEDTVEIGLTSKEADDFIRVFSLSPAYQAWMDLGEAEPYVSWLEKRVEQVLISHPEFFDSLKREDSAPGM